MNAGVYLGAPPSVARLNGVVDCDDPEPRGQHLSGLVHPRPEGNGGKKAKEGPGPPRFRLNKSRAKITFRTELELQLEASGGFHTGEKIRPQMPPAVIWESEFLVPGVIHPFLGAAYSHCRSMSRPRRCGQRPLRAPH